MSLYLSEALHEARLRTLEQSCVSSKLKAQRAIEGCETETRKLLGGTEGTSVSPTRGRTSGSLIASTLPDPISFPFYNRQGQDE